MKDDHSRTKTRSDNDSSYGVAVWGCMPKACIRYRASSGQAEELAGLSEQSSSETRRRVADKVSGSSVPSGRRNRIGMCYADSGNPSSKFR